MYEILDNVFLSCDGGYFSKVMMMTSPGGDCEMQMLRVDTLLDRRPHQALIHITCPQAAVLLHPAPLALHCSALHLVLGLPDKPFFILMI